MSSTEPLTLVNPKPFLKTLVDSPVVVRLKWNRTEYRGVLTAIDNYMNLLLANATESVEPAAGEETAETLPLGDIFIRCNNVLFVRGDS